MSTQPRSGEVIFSPTWSAAECGVAGNPVREPRSGEVMSAIDRLAVVIHITSPLCGSDDDAEPATPHSAALHVGLNITSPLRGYINPKVCH